jgi:hypothetical protein
MAACLGALGLARVAGEVGVGQAPPVAELPRVEHGLEVLLGEALLAEAEEGERGRHRVVAGQIPAPRVGGIGDPARRGCAKARAREQRVPAGRIALEEGAPDGVRLGRVACELGGAPAPVARTLEPAERVAIGIAPVAPFEGTEVALGARRVALEHGRKAEAPKGVAMTRAGCRGGQERFVEAVGLARAPQGPQQRGGLVARLVHQRVVGGAGKSPGSRRRRASGRFAMGIARASRVVMRQPRRT